ncbi:MAG: YbjQ family protein [bacterium]
MNHNMTTTTFELAGYEIVQNIGVVRGITVRSRSVIGNIGAGLQSLFGGNITIFTNLCEQAREEAFQMMCKHAEQLGANAVVSVAYDATEIMQGITEVICYGTAVTVKPKA